MPIDPMNPAAANTGADALLRRLLAGMSIFTMLMTIPQVYTIWINHQAAGVSVLSWSAYLLAALLWFVHGVRSGDRNIYLACVGWVILDIAVVVGAAFYG
jgi:uncharacterized protein with PQ loop repeat